MIVCKFGGSSLANAERIRHAADIVRCDKERRYIVVSAPGKQNKRDEKITDLLLRCQKQGALGLDFSAPFAALRDRFYGIVAELGLPLSLEEEFDALKKALKSGASRDYAASRGEYFNARIMAAELGFPFLDAQDLVCFDESAGLDAKKTLTRLAAALKNTTRAVLPGFYGAYPNGDVCVFSRGGSDVTGALVAAAADADLYENWTDVSGLMMADPRIVPDAVGIPVVTYRELRELSYMGATVLHEDAVFPVRTRNIPIRICNTAKPEDPGTRIVSDAPAKTGAITGIAGKKGFSALYLEKDRMRAEVGFLRKALSVLEEMKISIEHMPSGIDTLSVVLDSASVAGRENELIARMQKAVQPDRLHLENGFALIAVVGRGMIRSPGSAARLFAALAHAGINVRMIDQGSSELSIIVGVNDSDFESTIHAIYHEFVG